MFRSCAIAILLLAGLTLLATAESPLVVAHRGASGYLPEHTLEAYAVAHAMEADYIEPDLVMTKDAHLICLHDINLEATTDVEERFPNRKRADGRWYAADFTLAEVKSLRVHERLDNRFSQAKSSFEVPTFEEMIELIQGLNQSTGREAGIYPELKQPEFHEKEGLPLETRVLEVLTRYGYEGRSSKCIVQCFYPDTLKKLRNEHKTELRLIQVVGGKVQDDLMTQDGLKEIATYADGIGPEKGRLLKTPELAEWAHDLGLKVHVYTLRADDVGKQFATFEDELTHYFTTLGVDGIWTDHPDRAVAWLKANSK